MLHFCSKFHVTISKSSCVQYSARPWSRRHDDSPEKSAATHLTTLLHIPEDWNMQQYRWHNLKYRFIRRNQTES